jgi:GDP-4-dehydro-6-deoxy-D-mannose reductase
MRSLVTGADGFIGSWLTRALVAAGDQVDGLSRSKGTQVDGVVRHLCDITDAASVNRVVKRVQPDRVFHLAALNNIADSFASPLDTVKSNIEGSLNVLEALRTFAPGSTFVSVGSSSEYGLLTEGAGGRLNEDMTLWPSSPYGATKAVQGMLVRIYARTSELRAIHVRPFAVIGPGKERDALSDFCRAVVEIESGYGTELRVGNIDAIRDFIDVRDCIRALIRVAERGERGEVYNICNGHGESLRTIIAILQENSSSPFSVVEDRDRLRPTDEPRLVGDCRKLSALGYAPTCSLAESVRLTLDHWRERAVRT